MRPRLGPLIALVMLLGLLAACGATAQAPPKATTQTPAKKTTATAPTQPTAATTVTAPKVFIQSPLAGAKLTPGPLNVRLVVWNFQLVRAASNDAPGTGQVVLFVNGHEVATSTFLHATITLSGQGPETIKAELIRNGQLIPTATATVTVSVEPASSTSTSPSSSSSGSGSSPSSGSPTGSTGSPSSSSGTTTTATAYTVTSRQATVAGSLTTVLTDSQGLTLYYLTTDSATSSTCTGSCASIWPPLLHTSGTPTLAPGIPGTLAVIQDQNGAQVTYNGHPLYTYSGDTKPGEANGQGLLGTWFVVTPGL